DGIRDVHVTGVQTVLCRSHAPLAARERALHLELPVPAAEERGALGGVDPVVDSPPQTVLVVFDAGVERPVAVGDERLLTRLALQIGSASCRGRLACVRVAL